MDTELSKNNYKVYKHTTPSGKVYIGITKKNAIDRWAGGFGYEHQVYFFRAIVKYGWINIKHEILFDGLSKEDAEAKEIELISEYKSSDLNYGYNIDLGGDLHRLSLESRKKISNTKKGKKWSERQRLASIEYFDKFPGKTVYKYDLDGNLLETFRCSKEAYKDTNVSLKVFRTYLATGKFPISWKYIYTYCEFKKDAHKTPRQFYNAKPIDMYDLSLNYIKTFNSIEDAKRYLGGGGNHIWDVCNGKRLKCNNYIWRYSNDNRNN